MKDNKAADSQEELELNLSLIIPMKLFSIKMLPTILLIKYLY